MYDDCSEAEEPTLPGCTIEIITLYDPRKHTITHWLEGPRAGHSSVVFEIVPSRAREIEDDTKSIPDESGTIDTEDAIVTSQNLGQKTIDGISVTGSRTIVTLPARARGNKETVISTHEVWISAEMNLVVKVIDAEVTSGNPDKIETIRGLKDISLSPDPALFLPPDDYQREDWRVTNPGKPGDELAERDMPQYAAWFVK
ncbi:MAG TPA: hypothetical protein VL346_07420 [Acidobacteriaceae bacterium]|nr:hypothetical protein [Acidobacteriaceae bacterium]